ncbi:hypothetical protein F5Y15DRAFT_424216 [Xylariaceae sp. FL0016]|nr:hypothetical protein F5Y15DRAFT_424216 [Xylariaceae sp. FL0016]
MSKLIDIPLRPLRFSQKQRFWKRNNEEIAQSSHRQHDVQTAEEVQKQPWRFIGYEGYARRIALDDDLLIVRRFPSLNARVTLRIQDKVVALEQRLRETDFKYRDAADPVNNGSLRDDKPDRDDLMDELELALMRYNEFLAQQSTLGSFKKAPLHDVRSLKIWHENFGNAVIDEEERDYLNYSDDLVNLFSKDKIPLRRIIDNSLWMRTL